MLEDSLRYKYIGFCYITESTIELVRSTDPHLIGSYLSLMSQLSVVMLTAVAGTCSTAIGF